MIATMMKATRICTLLALAMALAGPALSRAEAPADEDGLFLTVPNPITSDDYNRLKAQTEEARERFRKSLEARPRKTRLKVVFDFNPDGKPSQTSELGPCLELAIYLAGRTDITSIAFVHQKVTGHTVLPVLACQNLVMAPETGELGEVLKATDNSLPRDTEQFYQDHLVVIYRKVASDRGRCPAIVLKMLDKNMEVMVGTRKGGVWYVDNRLLEAEKKAGFILTKPNANENPMPMLPAGKTGLYTTNDAKTYGLSQLKLSSRQEIVESYDMPLSSLRGDPLQGRTPDAWRVVVRGALTPVLLEGLERRIKQAVGKGANFIIVQLECGGGDPVVAGDLALFLVSLKDDQGQLPVKTVAYVTEKAGDLALLPALGCNEIVMAPKSRLGDFERYLRKYPNHRPGIEGVLLELARQRYYSPQLVQGMIDPDLVLYAVHSRKNPFENRFLKEADWQQDQAQPEPAWAADAPMPFKAAGTWLVLDADAAVKHGFCRFQAPSINQVYEGYGLKAAKVRQADPDWLDQVAAFLRNELIRSLLVMVGITCLILELKMPGATMPGIISALCFILFFWAHAELAFTWLAVLLFLLALVLIALEIFVVPGFGALGICGILLLLGSLALATLQRWPQTQSDWYAMMGDVARFGGGLIGAVVVSVMLARYLPSIPYANRLVLVPPSERTPEVTGEDLGQKDKVSPALLGAIGVAATDLRPAGMVHFGDDFIDVVAEGSYVPAGTRVQVVEIEGYRVVVKEV